MEQEALKQYIVNAVGTYRQETFAGVTGHFDALLLKRSPFAHENEVRLLYVDAKGEFAQDQLEIPIDVNSVIDEITLDARVINGGGEPKRREWLQANGFKNPINLSHLYLGVIVSVPLFKPEDLEKYPKPSD
jgi:hypothetical protein